MNKFDNRRPTSFAIAKPNAVRKLEDDAGMVGRFLTKNETRRDAGKALTELKRAEVEAATRIGKTNIAIAEATLTGAMVAEGMTSIAVLAVDINTRTGAAVSRISAATGAVATSRGAPPDGSEVIVTGRFRMAFAIGSASASALIEADWRKD